MQGAEDGSSVSKNDEFVKTRNSVSKTRNFVSKMMKNDEKWMLQGSMSPQAWLKVLKIAIEMTIVSDFYIESAEIMENCP